jgi:hypothetical protein
MTHKAKIDWWIAVSLALGILAPLAGTELWITIPLFLAVGICGYPQSYQTAEEGLIIRAGLIRRVIPYDAITFVGLSDGRVSIRYGTNAGIAISPADSRAFLEDMASRARHLTRRGQNLAPALA